MKRLSQVMLVMALVLGWTSRARAEAPLRPEVQKIYDEATALFNQEQYQLAIDKFRVAFGMQANPKILYSWAQSTRLLGDCGEAINLYRRYLATLPSEGGANAARGHIATCQTILGSGGPTPSPSASPQPSPSPSPLASPQPSPSPEPSASPEPSPSGAPLPSRRVIPARHWYQDILGDALVGAGAVGLGVGIVYFMKSSTSEDDAKDAMTYGDYSDMIDQAKSERTIAITSLALGGALAAYGVVRWMTYGRPERALDDASTRRQTGTTVGLFGLPAGGGLVVDGHF